MFRHGSLHCWAEFAKSGLAFKLTLARRRYALVISPLDACTACVGGMEMC